MQPLTYGKPLPEPDPAPVVVLELYHSPFCGQVNGDRCSCAPLLRVLEPRVTGKLTTVAIYGDGSVTVTGSGSDAAANNGHAAGGIRRG